jgi:hypothetical protein
VQSVSVGLIFRPPSPTATPTASITITPSYSTGASHYPTPSGTASATATPSAAPADAFDHFVVRVGDGVAALGTYLAAPVFLDEYTATGVYKRSIGLPTTASGNQYACTLSSHSGTRALFLCCCGASFMFTGACSCPRRLCIAFHR